MLLERRTALETPAQDKEWHVNQNSVPVCLLCCVSVSTRDSCVLSLIRLPGYARLIRMERIITSKHLAEKNDARTDGAILGCLLCQLSFLHQALHHNDPTIRFLQMFCVELILASLSHRHRLLVRTRRNAREG